MRLLSILMIVVGLASFMIGVHGGTLVSEKAAAMNTEEAIQAMTDSGSLFNAIAMEFRTLFILAGGFLLMGGAFLMIRFFRRFD